MLLPTVVLEASMTVTEARARLARYGFWNDPHASGTREWLEESAARIKGDFLEVAERLQRDPDDTQVALRRQWRTQILWYSRWSVRDLLTVWLVENDDLALIDLFSLHEPDSHMPLQVDENGAIPSDEGVVLLGDRPVGVNRTELMMGVDDDAAATSGGASTMPSPASAGGGGASRGGGGGGGGSIGGIAGFGTPRPPSSSPPAPSPAGSAPTGSDGAGHSGAHAVPKPAAPTIVRAWPRMDAPDYVPANKEFKLTVGLGKARQKNVVGAEVRVEIPAGSEHVDVDIELIADGLDAKNGWSQSLRVLAANPTANSVSFVLVGHEPDGPEPFHLTTLEVRYVLKGTICGTSSRPLVIGASNQAILSENSDKFGTSWSDTPAVATPIVLQAETNPADLTIEIAKPNGNSANGTYQCKLFSPHPLPDGAGPFMLDLGQDSRTFSQAVVREIRNYAGDPLVENMLRAWGDVIGGKLPVEARNAIRAIAKLTHPKPPAVLLVSADPYVPWELALLDPPIDSTRPPYLGAQVVLGRWLRDSQPSDGHSTSNSSATGLDSMGGAPSTSVEAPPPRPPAQPPSTLGVKHMAVMAGMYQASSGLRNLPEAESEATSIAGTYDAVQLAATTADVRRLLNADLSYKFQQIGGVEAIHFAGHGDVDPSVADGSMLMLSDSRPLPSILFRSAKYGGKQQPFFFLNACMIGIGGELLGDMGGFPGNCLRGGFGGVLGALWEVDDTVAHNFAVAFWKRALPTDSDTRPEEVGEILRDLRKHFDATADIPVHTWLAYVYYGHPRLTLHRV